MPWKWRMMQNLNRNWLVVSKLTWGISRILSEAPKSLTNLHFNELFLIKVYNFWSEKVQRSYVWWHWRLMQNLKESWLLLSKMAWGVWQIFTRALGSLKIAIYRRVMCHDNEEWCTTWKRIDLPVQNWHEEFDGFWH